MANILVVDDTLSMLQLISLYLKAQGHQVTTAIDGTKALDAVQKTTPDLIITDVMMPGMDGYEFTRRLRRTAATARTPIITLTAHSELESKLKAFEAGADDFMTKPFDPGELVARVNALLKRAPAITGIGESETMVHEGDQKLGHLIVVHSLRGGAGCSSIAANLAVGLAGLWNDPTLLADFVTTAGQAALMLNLPLKRTWADIMHIPLPDLAVDELEAIIATHGSELRVLPAPTDPMQSAHLSQDRVDKIVRLLMPRYGHIIAEVDHNFGEVAVHILDNAELILMVLAPDLGSIRAAAAALEAYHHLGYPDQKIRVIMNWTFAQQGFARQEIEQVLGLPVSTVIPFAPLMFVGAINRGTPPLIAKPEESVSVVLEDLAYQISGDNYRAAPPPEPKPAWKRVQRRLGSARK